VNLAELLPGARIQRIDAPFPELFALSVRKAEMRGVLLLGVAPRARGVGFTSTRPRGDQASGLVSALRKHLEGGRVLALQQPQPGLIVLRVSRSERDSSLVAQLFGRGNLLLLDAEQRARNSTKWGMFGSISPTLWPGSTACADSPLATRRAWSASVPYVTGLPMNSSATHSGCSASALNRL
jgi:hypothetical protein